MMDTRIESDYDVWKRYNTTAGEYVIGRSCKYDSTFCQLTVRIFVHQLRDGDEFKIGEISISVERDDWKQKGNLNNAVEADNQLREACVSAKHGDWGKEVLTRMLNQGFEEIKNQIEKYEKEGAEINGEFAMQ
jgi:hypothetical protein